VDQALSTMQRQPHGMMWIKVRREDHDQPQFLPVSWNTENLEHDPPDRATLQAVPVRPDAELLCDVRQLASPPVRADDNTTRDDACILCMERAPDMMLIPCGHRCFCRKCIVETICIAIRSEAPACPLCRTTIDNMVLLD